MTDATYTAADMRAAWEAGRYAAAAEADRHSAAYGAKMHKADDRKEKRDWQSMLMAAVDMKHAILALTPLTAALAEGNKP